MRPHHTLVACSALSALVACSGGGEPSKPAEKDTPPAKTEAKPEPAKEPVADAPVLDLSGPTPPEVSAALFAVDGALIPLGCYDQPSKQLLDAKDCADNVVIADTEVLLWADTGRVLDKIGAHRNALCEIADTPRSYATAATEGGQTFQMAVIPKGLGATAHWFGPETRADKVLALTEEEKTALVAAVKAAGGKPDKGPLRLAQRASVDFDGDGAAEHVFSVIVDNPDDSTHFYFTGIFVAWGGSLAALELIDKSKRADTFYLRSAVDLDGDKRYEAHIGITFDGGSADRVAVLAAKKAPRFLGGWTCGA